MGRDAARHLFFLCSMLAAGLLVTRGVAVADITGSVELSDTAAESKVSDATGLTSNARVNSLLQRYTLYYTQALYPYLNLRVGGSFDKTINVSTGDAGNARGSDTSIFPSADLTLNNPFVSAGVGVSRREETVEATGAAATTTIQDRQSGYLNFRPEGLPSLDLQATDSHSYDKAHQMTDSKNDMFSVGSRYSPVRNLDLGYTLTLFKNKDLLSGAESDTTTQNGRAAYSNRFFDRISFSTDYTAIQSTTETLSGSSGEVAFQVFPFAGLSDISDTPTLEVLSPNQALIDGNITASSGINIGQGVSFGGDTRLRNVGLDFGTANTVNTLYIYVDRQLPASVAGAIAWDLYVSSDNQNWTLSQTGLHGFFNPFLNRFELTFPDVTARYIKASTRPVAVTVLAPPGTDISNIFITELQALINKPAAQAAGKTVLRSDLFDANASVALVKDQLLVYSVFFSEAKATGAHSATFLSNSLSSMKQFNRVFSGNARVAREDSDDPTGKIVAYTGSVSLSAVPLPTLSHSLIVSYRTQDLNGQTSRTTTAFLNNAANLYQGVDVNLSGGISYASVATGGTSESTILNGGISIVPNTSLSLNANHSETQSILPGGMINRAVSSSAGIAWSPIQTVYLAYSISKTSATGIKDQTSQNYSATWSPFSTGALSFTASYIESWVTPLDTMDRALAFGALWRLGPRIFLSGSYAVLRSSSPSQLADTKSFNTDLRMSF